MKVLIFTTLFLASHFLLTAHWQVEGGKTDLAWVNAKANLSTVASYSPNYKITASSDKVLVAIHKKISAIIFEKLYSFKSIAPIYILNCSYLL